MSNYIETAFMQQRTDFMKTLPDRRKRFPSPTAWTCILISNM